VDKSDFTLRDVPISIINRALDLYNCPRETRLLSAWNALYKADVSKDAPDGPYTPFAQAVAEYLSEVGPWGEGGKYYGENGYKIDSSLT